MGNSLLDFVMALVRDPQAAARYAADPAAALAEADLPAVTVADVANLIPVVTDSLAMSTPAAGAVVDAANVWASGAAAAAFEAFDLTLPAPTVQAAAPQVMPVEDAPDIAGFGHPDPAPDAPRADPLSEYPPAPQPAADDWADDHGWQQSGWPQSHDPQAPDHHPAAHHPADPPGFDVL